MPDPARSLALAEQVASTARRLGIETALIGAAALAVHRYTRGTEDIDLAAAVDPNAKLVALQEELTAAGLRTVLRLPDEDDPLGGVLSVSTNDDPSGEAGGPVEVVNFMNPGRNASTPAVVAIQRATAIAGSPLRCVSIPDLVALKLYAGGLSDHADIVELLARNPEADLRAVRLAAGPYDRDHALERLLDAAVARWTDGKR